MLPAVDPDSEWRWTALAAGEGLLLPRCATCERFSFPPMAGCPYCGGGEFDRLHASGRGEDLLLGRRPHAPERGLRRRGASTIATVELEEGPRVFGRLFGDTKPAAGARVRMVPYERAGATLLGFELDGG